ncbi:VapC toxin [Cuniculiplasma divulgatum]|uniref:VapC toxin n=1 Tax=Cuniculiplasma divulgatum TaxID=1673428 RepID=A0A1N5TL18_9ARCH|nr:VapC toxin [Cuniculiplasma divulgatum]
MIGSELFNKKRPVISQGDFKLLAVNKRQVPCNAFGNVNPPGAVSVNVKLACAFLHIYIIIQTYIKVFISLHFRKFYILIIPYGNIQKYKVILK